jgi:hypothetical protein
MRSPEIISGENFVDVIFEDKTVSSSTQIRASFDKETQILTIHNLVTNKNDSMPIPQLHHKNYLVSNISVINGIVRIRLD